MKVQFKPIHGLLLLDKPPQMTSNQALMAVKRLFAAEKAGHTGSLDPLATGMLPLCLGEATKFCQYLLTADKHYEVVAQLGVATTTGDAEGEIIEQKPVPTFSSSQLNAAIASFQGNILQVPSMYSAIKHQGQPLYKLARQGVEVERKPRTVTIYQLTLVSYEQDQIALQVHCSKGTYVRTLVEDLGKALNVPAHVKSLRRTRVGHFPEHQMISLEQLRATDPLSLHQHLLPMDAPVSNLSKIILSETSAFYLQRGQAVRTTSDFPDHTFVYLSTEKGEFLGIGEVMEGKVAPRRLVQKNI